MLYQNNTEPGGDYRLHLTNDFVAVRDGTTDFIDFDSDGDLDVIYTGTAVQEMSLRSTSMSSMRENRMAKDHDQLIRD